MRGFANGARILVGRRSVCLKSAGRWKNDVLGCLPVRSIVRLSHPTRTSASGRFIATCRNRNPQPASHNTTGRVGQADQPWNGGTRDTSASRETWRNTKLAPAHQIAGSISMNAHRTETAASWNARFRKWRRGFWWAGARFLSSQQVAGRTTFWVVCPFAQSSACPTLHERPRRGDSSPPAGTGIHSRPATTQRVGWDKRAIAGMVERETRQHRARLGVTQSSAPAHQIAGSISMSAHRTETAARRNARFRK